MVAFIDGIIARVYEEDGQFTECDESFTPVEEEDWEETLREPCTPARIRRIKRQNEILGWSR